MVSPPFTKALLSLGQYALFMAWQVAHFSIKWFYLCDRLVIFLPLNNVSSVKIYEQLEFLNHFKSSYFKTEIELIKKKPLGKS